MTAVQPLRTALIGFGLSGRDFHAPFIQADPSYSLDFIVTGSPERAARAGAAYPDTAVVASTAELFSRADELDLVLVCTPPATHVELAGTAIGHGLNVVVDKPFAPTAADAEELINQARQGGVVLSVYQNRRWDADYLTLKQLVEAGELGRVHRFESRFERWSPHGLRSWKGTAGIAEGGGILFDLGSHLVDQALQLFGPVSAVHGELARHIAADGSDADDDAFVSLLHESGVRSHLSMNLISGLHMPRFHVLGSGAAYTKWGLDTQEAALAAGLGPTDPGYGVEPEPAWGTLGVPGSSRKVEAVRGAYPEFYRQLAAALRGDGPVPVDPADAVAVLHIIEEVHWQAGA
jgi:scyllo-inositol 2-dehydrogenase (NADP+)